MDDAKSLDLRQGEVMVLTTQDEECTPDVLRIAPVWPVAGSSGVAITDAGVTVVYTELLGLISIPALMMASCQLAQAPEIEGKTVRGKVVTQEQPKGGYSSI